MAYAPINAIAGMQPFTELMTPDTTGGPAVLSSGPDGRRIAPGFVLDAVDPYFGYGRFMYLKAGQAETPGGLVMITDQTFSTTTLPTTTLRGWPFLVARQVMVQNSWGWYQFEGITPLQSTGGAVGAAVGIGAAGKAGANSAGSQLLGVRCLQTAAFTLTKTGTTINGSPVVQVSNVDGLFYGLAVTGTGIPGSSTITGSPNPIDPGQRQIVLNNNATANGTVTLTFTYTGFMLAHIMNPTTQSAIT